MNPEIHLPKWYSVFTDVTAEDASEKKKPCYTLNTLGRKKGFSNEVREEKDNPCSKSIQKPHPE